MKNGGAEVRVLDNKRLSEGGEDYRGTIVTAARQAAEMSSEDSSLAGYVIIGLYSDGLTSLSFRYDHSKAMIPKALIPAWLAEVLRRDILAHGEARDTFNQMFEWRDG